MSSNVDSGAQFVGELGKMSHEASTLLLQRGENVAVAESSCGGLISASLVAVPGASAFYIGGGIVYTAQSGRLLVPGRPKGMRSASEEFALFEARTIRERMGADWGVGETGASGPSGNPYGDPAGHACIAVSGPVERVITLATGDTDRGKNMWLFAQAALALLAEALAAV